MKRLHVASKANLPIHYATMDDEMRRHRADKMHLDLLYNTVEIAYLLSVHPVTVQRWLTLQHEGRMQAR